jgi:hypothetical protein
MIRRSGESGLSRPVIFGSQALSLQQQRPEKQLNIEAKFAAFLVTTGFANGIPRHYSTVFAVRYSSQNRTWLLRESEKRGRNWQARVPVLVLSGQMLEVHATQGDLVRFHHRCRVHHDSPNFGDSQQQFSPSKHPTGLKPSK